MDNGLGRTGYLLLATIMFVIGLLGLGAAYLAYLDGTLRFFQMGLGLAAVALVGIFAFAFYAPWLAAGPRRAARAPKTAPVQPAPAQAAPVAAPIEAAAPLTASSFGEVDFEFGDAVPAGGPAATTPAATATPAAPVAPRTAPQPAAERDPAAWPQRRGQPGRAAPKSDWTTRIEQQAKVQAQIDESAERRKLSEKYTENTPTMRAILTEPPLHVAERAPEGIAPGFTAPGMNVGQCGRCHTVVMAPTERPLRLKCPECAKVTLLA